LRVVLVNPPDEIERILGVGKEFIQKYEPLGLLYIAAVLRELGHEVRVIDAHAEGLDRDDIMRRLAGEAPDAVGLSTLTCNGAVVWELGRELKRGRPDLLLVLGNIHASVFADAYLRHGCCDVVVHGEGEHAMAEVLRCRAEGRGFEGVAGISYRNADGRVLKTSAAAVVKDLATLPFPARDLVDQGLYGLRHISNQLFQEGRNGRAKTMITSRGCPHRCTFCVVHGSRRPRYNSPARVVDEMELLQKDYGASYVFVDDPLFLADGARVEAICDEYLRRGLTLRWGGPAHVRYVTARLVERMDAANCFDLGLGIESGVQRVLDSVRKDFKVEQAVEAVRTIKERSDILVEGLFILGLPGETMEEAERTIRFACELPLDMAQFAVFTPYPGSPLFRDLAARGEIDTGVRDDGTVDPSVWGRYSQYICFTDNEPIWVPPGYTAAGLRALQKRALRAFYLRPAQVWRHIRRLRPGNVVSAARIAWRGFF